MILFKGNQRWVQRSAQAGTPYTPEGVNPKPWIPNPQPTGLNPESLPRFRIPYMLALYELAQAPAWWRVRASGNRPSPQVIDPKPKTIDP